MCGAGRWTADGRTELEDDTAGVSDRRSMAALTGSSDELFVQPVGQDGFSQTPAHSRSHRRPHLLPERTRCFVLPKIIFEATRDGLVVPGICVQGEVSWGCGCCRTAGQKTTVHVSVV